MVVVWYSMHEGEPRTKPFGVACVVRDYPPAWRGLEDRLTEMFWSDRGGEVPAFLRSNYMCNQF